MAGEYILVDCPDGHPFKGRKASTEESQRFFAACLTARSLVFPVS
jgi:hypothetical protein